jgi:hypothetical protein
VVPERPRGFMSGFYDDQKVVVEIRRFHQLAPFVRQNPGQ